MEYLSRCNEKFQKVKYRFGKQQLVLFFARHKKILIQNCLFWEEYPQSILKKKLAAVLSVFRYVLAKS
jgi:hypothetical protein